MLYRAYYKHIRIIAIDLNLPGHIFSAKILQIYGALIKTRAVHLTWPAHFFWEKMPKLHSLEIKPKSEWTVDTNLGKTQTYFTMLKELRNWQFYPN